MSSPTATSCISASRTKVRRQIVASDRLFFEDFRQGDIAEYGDVTVSAADIVTFAEQFDPQPFHLDDEAAKPVAGGLIASGWHAAALLLRMNCDAFLCALRSYANACRSSERRGDQMDPACPSGRPAACAPDGSLRPLCRG